MKLYKYKSGKDEDIDALLEDKLWVSNLYNMNDPMDLAFYIDKKVDLDEDIVSFQEKICKLVPIISFSTSIKNKRLWNYYTNGMCGMVLTYKKKDIENALVKMNVTSSSSPVLYDSDRFDLTDFYLKFQSNYSFEDVFAWKMFFTKDKSWAEESEYRFSLSTNFLLSENGSIVSGKLLNDIRPYEICIGYKMNKNNIKKIFNYCKKNNIKLNVASPDFNSKKSGDIIIKKYEESILG